MSEAKDSNELTGLFIDDLADLSSLTTEELIDATAGGLTGALFPGVLGRDGMIRVLHYLHERLKRLETEKEDDPDYWVDPPPTSSQQIKVNARYTGKGEPFILEGDEA